LSSLAISVWLFVLASGAGLLSARWSGFLEGTITTVFGLLVILPLAYLSLLAGLNPVVAKYGTHFSALSFLLSPDREHYVIGGSLVVRYVIAHSAIQLVLAFAQYPIWLWLTSLPRSEIGQDFGAALQPIRL
jgi:hypothetical protein